MIDSNHSVGCACAKCLALADGEGLASVHTGQRARQAHPHTGNCASQEHDHDHVCREGHAHDHENCSCAQGVETIDRKVAGRIIAAAALLMLGAVIGAGEWVRFGIFAAAYVIVGYDVVYRAGKNLIKSRSLDENLLMTIAGIGAFVIGERAEGVLVMLLYQIGEMFQGYAVGSSRKSIRSLVDMRPETVNVLRGENTVTVAADTVRIGDIMIVKPGERIALDGEIIQGESTLDTSALTGESLARQVEIGDRVLSGCLNQVGVLKIRVTEVLAQSAVSRILTLVEEAAERKAQPEKFITRFARIYTPVVFIAAITVAIIPPLTMGLDWYDWVYRALTFLVISCPCALVISVPLTYFAGIGGASKRGILFKGSSSMDIMSRVDTVVFDKTGTLTTGEFRVFELQPIQGVSERRLMELGAYAEAFSDHPLARSIVSEYGGAIDTSRISEYSEQRGKGVSARIDSELIIAGNSRFLKENGIEVPGGDGEEAAVCVASADGYLGRIILGDTIKSGSHDAVERLKEKGVNRTLMLTGDNPAAGAKTAGALGISEYYAGCLPEDKARIMEEIMEEMVGAATLAYVGDGINDAPVLTLADVGIAMGGLGSDAAIEAADVVIMDDEPSKIPVALDISAKTKSIVVQNIALALSVKALFLVLGALGYSAMAAAIFADVGVSLLAIFNAMRAAKSDRTR